NDTLRNRITEKDIVALMPDDVKAEHRRLADQVESLDRQKPKRYPTARAIGESGRQPLASYFLHRGNVDSKGTAMTPGVLSVVSDTDWNFLSPPDNAKSSWRRRGFAEWLTSPQNPLAARVMVNRIWQHHFGEGIVRTPSNFGKLGER